MEFFDCEVLFYFRIPQDIMVDVVTDLCITIHWENVLVCHL